MSDLYRELLVKRETPASEKIQRAVLIAATAAAAVVSIFVTPIAFIVLVILCVVDYLKLPAYNLEFEYLYVNGELDVDKIISRNKRKRAASYEMGKVELLAPYNSHELDYHKQGKKLKVTDFSSGSKDSFCYGMIYNGPNGQEMVILELDEIMLNDIKRIVPRNVKLG